MATIAVIGTLDTKGEELAWLARAIRERGHQTLLVDLGTGSPPILQPDLSREAVLQAAGRHLEEVLLCGDRGRCVEAMAQAAPVVMKQWVDEGKMDGVISMGGGGGTSISTAAMRALPVGFPKVMITTMASGDVSAYLETSDIVMMPSVVDVSGLNSILRGVMERGAGAICGMVEAFSQKQEEKPTIVASMFGNTTSCVEHARSHLEESGFEVLVFHATGAGGRTMETLIESGLAQGVLDITATEWADELVGGVLSAGPHRHEASGKAAVPSVVVPGCLDMVNFHAPDTIPSVFADRQFYAHNPQVTLMRTTPEECAQLGIILADKINAYTAPVTVLLPLGGLSVIGGKGGPFHDPVADAQLFKSLQQGLRKGIEVVSLDLEINHPQFAEACTQALLKNMEQNAATKACGA